MSRLFVVAAIVLLSLSPFSLRAEERVPLSELGSRTYRGQRGGLYGEGRNEPPKAHKLAAEKVLAEIEPLGESGRPAKNGKIVLLSIGMSNTTQEFAAFQRLANADSRKRREVVLVNGSQGGRDARSWANDATGDDERGTWAEVARRLELAEVTPAQVQVVWIKHALAGPARYGEFPRHAEALADDLQTIVREARKRFPNLRAAFLSSRIYGGYADADARLNPEPYAYESAFAVRQVIERQISGDRELNFDAMRGAVHAPLLLWGPYLWADGQNPRKADQLTWQRNEFAKDGTHPNQLGCQKVAEQLLKFFTTDKFGKSVFCSLTN